MNKILHLERKFTSSTETFIVNQINSLNKFKHFVFTIIFLNNLKSNANVKYPVKNKKWYDNYFLSKNNKIHFLKQYELLKPNIIHSHYLTDASYFHPFTKSIKIPKICSCYGYDVSHFPKKYFIFSKYYFRRVFKDYDKFLVMSEDMKYDLISLGCPESKIIIHYHGILTDNFTKKRDYTFNTKTFNILTIGSLVSKKGHIYILKAINLLNINNSEINIKYTIVGVGPLERDLRKYVISNHLEEIVEFKGIVKHGDQFNAILEWAHVFVHPSIITCDGDKEGIPGTIVEAMASGLPVISTYHAGIPYIITDNVNGLLVKERDSHSIADKILYLFENKEKMKLLGEEAKNYAQMYLDINIKTKNLEYIYNSLI